MFWFPTFCACELKSPYAADITNEKSNIYSILRNAGEKSECTSDRR